MGCSNNESTKAVENTNFNNRFENKNEEDEIRERVRKEEEERIRKEEGMKERIRKEEEERIRKEEEIKERIRKEGETAKNKEDKDKIRIDEEAQIKKKEEEERKKKEEEEERIKRDEYERLKREEEERIKKEEEEKIKREEEERLKKEEEERIKKEEEERIKKEEEERIKRKEEEKIKKEEEERIKKEKEEERIKREEEEMKKKEEEERIKKEEEEKKKKEEEENKINSKENEEEYQKLKNEELSIILPSDQDKPSQSCIFLGVHGNFYTDKEKALQRINDIRKEACNEGVKDPETKKKFKPSDYKPYKWSTELESIARIRSMEGGLTMAHSRLNGKSIFTVEKNGIRSWAENLAWNWDNANSIDMINQWYNEKHDWVTGGPGVTGHYESLISSRFSYVGLGWFNSKCTKYPSCLAGAFSDTAKGEDFIEEKKGIIQTVDVLKKNIKSYYLEGKKTMKTNETQILTPRIKLSNPDLSIWPLKRYDLTYTSSNSSIAKVDKAGKVEALKAGNATITCKNPENTNYATFNITIKCDHEKKLIKTVDSTCTKTGINTYECDICKTKVDSEIKMKPHDFKFTYSNGKSTGTCTHCKKVIACNPPSEFDIYWRNEETTEGSSYWSCVPSNNPIGSTIVGWVHKINGDNDYRELVAECDNEDALELPTDKIGEYVKVKVIGAGNVTLTVYAKYNPTLKHSYRLELGN